MTPRCEQRLKGVHPDLAWVIRTAADAYAPREFIVTEGLRTAARQGELVAAGASRTMNSRHLTGHAVDLAVKVGNEVRWDWPLYSALAEIVKQVARGLNVPIVWGGDWKNFRDGPHYELDRKAYP
jgi:peptidoglycan LD-endopeptidase CwlK